MSSGGWFIITAEGQVRAPDGHVVKRRVQCGGANGGPSLLSLFDTGAIFAFSPAAAGSPTPALSMSGSSTVTGGCGSNGSITGNGGPTITAGPLSLWGANASVSGVTLASGVNTITRSTAFWTPTADQAANLLRAGTLTGAGVSRWAPTGYGSSGQSLGPADSYGRNVNSQAQIVSGTDTFIRSVAANEFLDSNGYLVLDHHLSQFNGHNKLRLKPGVYYFHQINLTNSDSVEIANDWYKADGVTPLVNDNHQLIGSPGTVADYNSAGNRITIFVDAAAGANASSYADSGIGSGLAANLQGDKSTANPVAYRRPGNFRIYAKNTGNFSVKGSNSSPVEFNCNLLHYNADSSGNYYGAISLSSGCHLYGGLFGWTITMSGSANVQQYGQGVFGSNDPVTVIPGGGSGGSGTGGGVTGGFGGWYWTEIAAS